MLLPVKVIAEHETPIGGEATHTFAGIAALVAALDIRFGVTSRHLVIIVNAASEDAVNQRDLWMQFNGDAGANYHYQWLEGSVAVAAAARLNAQTQIAVFPFPGTNYASGFGGGDIVIPHAFNAANHKSIITLGGAVEDEVETVAGRWANIAAITSVTLLPSAGNFAAGSRFLLCVVDETYQLDETLLAAPGTITFDNIMQQNGDLAVIGYGRTDRILWVDSLIHEINDDIANYQRQFLSGTGAAPAANQFADRIIGALPGNTATANVLGPIIIGYSQFAQQVNQPYLSSLYGFHESIGPNSTVAMVSGRWPNNAAITKLEYYPSAGVNLLAGTLFSLYRVPRNVIKRIHLQADAPLVVFDFLEKLNHDFEALQITVYARSDAVPINDNLMIELNDDAVVANYDSQLLEGAAAVVTATQSAATQFLFEIPAAGEGGNEFGGGTILIPCYARDDRHKHLVMMAGRQENNVFIHSKRWEGTAPITKIELFCVGNFLAGSVFELSGILPRDYTIYNRRDMGIGGQLDQTGKIWR